MKQALVIIVLVTGIVALAAQVVTLWNLVEAQKNLDAMLAQQEAARGTEDWRDVAIDPNTFVYGEGGKLWGVVTSSGPAFITVRGATKAEEEYAERQLRNQEGRK